MKKLLIILFLLTSTAYGQGPCGNPNPPSWCNGGGGGGPCNGPNPPSWCGTTGVPINSEIWVLGLLGLGLGVHTYLKHKKS